METLYIVIWKHSNGTWHPEPQGVFTERRLAENLIECKQAAGERYKFAIVEGPIYYLETIAEAEARLGTF